MSARELLMAVIDTGLAVLVAPLLIGWVDQCRAWLQNRRGAGVLQSYRVLRKLMHKDAVIANGASPLFRASPYIQFGAMVLAAMIIPTFGADAALGSAADTIALVGVFAVARVFMALAAMDIGTAFGSLGARREMLIGFLAEPALLMVFFTASMISASTLLPTIIGTLSSAQLVIYPSLAFSAIAFVMVLLAENARVPIDNPTTHLELTMIHEAMVLEYSARHLALIEWGSALKLLNYVAIGIAMFAPWGLASSDAGLATILGAWLITLGKLAIAGTGLALIETLSAKLRIFRAPEFLATAFLLAVLGLLVHQLLEI
ncbi:NADH-quinone oxidoreductase subunit H [Thermomonas sp.]|uniref:respiratory chain complex I subunit 1 family protein n=1 Tax=Thermomonas sp. TaxID=1971895 RepID=UPI0024895080|nr:NADH-quinone oxidoreductase subunit H [Thermomonas sp.]MDI1253691.1 NADH-quinone oxidoreductase subunit H [Thermomonas sp.]